MVQILKEDVRKKLISEGFASFKEVGYRKTKISVIAKRAGITASTFYSYFPSKNDFLMQIFTTWIESIITEFFIDNGNCEAKSIEEDIRLFLYFSWIYLPKKDNYFVLNFLEAFLDSSSKELEEQEKYCMQDQEDFFKFYGQLIGDRLQNETFRAIGHMIRHTSLGFLIEYKINEDRATKDAEETISGFIQLLKEMKRI